MPDKLMRVPVFTGEGRMEFQDRPVPHIQHDDDVFLAVEACGLCGTDLNILAVPPAHKAAAGTVLGHEFVGTVRQVGNRVAGLKAGDRVVVAPRLNCGLCRYCRRGLVNQCESYKTLGHSSRRRAGALLHRPGARAVPDRPEGCRRGRGLR